MKKDPQPLRDVLWLMKKKKMLLQADQLICLQDDGDNDMAKMLTMAIIMTIRHQEKCVTESSQSKEGQLESYFTDREIKLRKIN